MIDSQCITRTVLPSGSEIEGKPKATIHGPNEEWHEEI